MQVRKGNLIYLNGRTRQPKLVETVGFLILIELEKTNQEFQRHRGLDFAIFNFILLNIKQCWLFILNIIFSGKGVRTNLHQDSMRHERSSTAATFWGFLEHWWLQHPKRHSLRSDPSWITREANYGATQSTPVNIHVFPSQWRGHNAWCLQSDFHCCSRGINRAGSNYPG